MPSPAILFAALLFGLVGIIAFNYGRKNACWGPMVLGLALMTFPYFVSQTWAVYLVGTGLCVGLYFWRE